MVIHIFIDLAAEFFFDQLALEIDLTWRVAYANFSNL